MPDAPVLFVRNIHYAVTVDELAALFAPFVRLRHLTIRRGGFAFVKMPRESHVDLAALIRSVNGTVLHGLALRVERARPRLRP
jgi:RNA recognition motif-containing protein